jgi:quercetin dioxygenase-like cupin family protein
MPRTTTKDRSSFTRIGDVTYTLPSPAFSSPVVTISLPPNSKWTSGLHWHETHTEYLAIIQGSALITLNSVTKTYTPSDGIIVIPRYARHEWRRASSSDEELIVQEWTDPEDGEKEVFFRNLSSVIEDATRDGKPNEWSLTHQLFVIFRALDNFPVLVDLSYVPVVGKGLEWAITHFVLGYAVLLGLVLGWKGVYPEYTPGWGLKEKHV